MFGLDRPGKQIVLATVKLRLQVDVLLTWELPSMAPSAQAHKRSHSLLLLQKLLNLRDNASPLTLVLDTLEQGAAPVLQEFTTRARVSRSTRLIYHDHPLIVAQISHTKVIFISFATIKRPANADILVRATGKSLQKLRSDIISHYPALPPPTARTLSSASSAQSEQHTHVVPLPAEPLSS